jgi:hypothetical protein
MDSGQPRRGFRNDERWFDLPDGQITDFPSSPFRKNFSLHSSTKSAASDGVPRPQEGRFAIVTDVGRGMRWTQMVLLTRAPDADGEVVWS